VCLQACRTLVACGADVMRRNNKNRVPGSQLKVRQEVLDSRAVIAAKARLGGPDACELLTCQGSVQSDCGTDMSVPDCSAAPLVRALLDGG
jgi:hypothetical protein